MQIISRQEALNSGLKRYFTGKPCKNGHVAERFTSIRGCVECCRRFNAEHFSRRYVPGGPFAAKRNEKSRAWARDNGEMNRERQRKWRAANPAKNREYCAKWQAENPEKAKESARKTRKKFAAKITAAIRDWKSRNPDRVKYLNHVGKARRRALERNASGTFTADDVASLYHRQSGKCAACPSTTSLQIDHIRALAKGGSNDPSNLQLLCRPCNLSKGTKDAAEWAREHGRDS